MDEQTVVELVGTGGMEVHLYAKGKEPLCTQPLPTAYSTITTQINNIHMNRTINK